MTLTPIIAERLVVDLSLPVLTTWVCRGWDLSTQPSACMAKRSNPLRHRRSFTCVNVRGIVAPSQERIYSYVYMDYL